MQYQDKPEHLSSEILQIVINIFRNLLRLPSTPVSLLPDSNLITMATTKSMKVSKS
jgi:hypothetical protein